MPVYSLMNRCKYILRSFLSDYEREDFIMADVRKFVECNDNVMVRIEVTPTIEAVGLFNDLVFEGMLKDVPVKFYDCEVVSEGYAINARLNVLTIM